jgi:hypothetical protein
MVDSVILPALVVNKATAQSVAGLSTWTDITPWDGEFLQQGVIYTSGNQIVVYRTGVYEFSYNMGMLARVAATDTEATVRFLKNGTDELTESLANWSVSVLLDNHARSHQFRVVLEDGDYVEMQVQWNHDTTVPTPDTFGGAAPNDITLSVRFIGELGPLVRGVAELVGSATATGDSQVLAIATGSSTGSATLTGTGQVLHHTVASASIVLASSVSSALYLGEVVPSVSREFFDRVSEIRPLEKFEAGLRGDITVNNTVHVAGPGSLSLSLSYSGPAYSLASPADTGSSPVKLGFKKGDKIRLIGPSGG